MQARCCFMEIFKSIRLPVAPAKLECLSTSLTFLGIKTCLWRIGYQQISCRDCRDLLHSWLSRSSCTKQELESLIGYLSHACYVVRAGKPFLRRLIELVAVVRITYHFVQLNASHRANLWWWEAFLAPLKHKQAF